MLNRSVAVQSILHLLIFLCLLSKVTDLHGQDNSASTNQATASDTVDLTWATPVQTLLQSNMANEFQLVEIENKQIPVFKFWPRGRLRRGTAIIVHGQGENPLHQRLILPLSQHLSELGWQILLPAIPEADLANFPSNSSSNLQNTTQVAVDSLSSAETGVQAQADVGYVTTRFFSSAEHYQKFVSNLLVETINQTGTTTDPLLLIVVQESSYWALDLLSQTTAISHVVLITPSLPKNNLDDLANRFANQRLPVYVFVGEENYSLPFIRLFEQQKWKSNNIRINRDRFIEHFLKLESTDIGKRITGWVSSMQVKRS